MRVARYALVASVVASVLASAPVALRAQRTAAPPATAQPARSIASQTAGMERHDGFIPFYYDEHTGKLLLEVQRLGQDFLYLPTLATGLGSNDLGLDRGTTGNEALVRFERDERIAGIVANWPRGIRATRAERLGLRADSSFADIIRQYIQDCEADPAAQGALRGLGRR